MIRPGAAEDPPAMEEVLPAIPYQEALPAGSNGQTRYFDDDQ